MERFTSKAQDPSSGVQGCAPARTRPRGCPRPKMDPKCPLKKRNHFKKKWIIWTLFHGDMFLLSRGKKSSGDFLRSSRQTLKCHIWTNWTITFKSTQKGTYWKPLLQQKKSCLEDRSQKGFQKSFSHLTSVDASEMWPSPPGINLKRTPP